MRLRIGAYIVCIAVLSGAGTSLGRERIILKDGWCVRQLDSDTPVIADLSRELDHPGPSWMKATMPAQVHEILLKHGKIPDPHVGRNAAESAWVGQKDWGYACRFASPPRQGGPVFLCFEGLDTLAVAYLNGTQIGAFDNMYRQYEVDVTDALVRDGGRNELVIVFSSALRYIEQMERPEYLKMLAAHKWLRKCHSDFGSYLGARPHSVKVGVFRDVVLDVRGRSWIEDVWVRPELSPDMQAARVKAQIEVGGADCTVDWTLTDPSGEKVATGRGSTTGGLLNVSADVARPRLWWPWTHGDPSLYRMRVQAANVLDEQQIDFGIRRIAPILDDPATGEKRFRFDINGKAIFLQGANWTPVEGMTHCWSSERATKLLDLMRHGRMNIMRIWGEGDVPPQQFYAECDRRGILIWQDFMFGYNMHPSGQPDFDANCRAEIEQMIRRLRNHPSILLWCGGNENHMGWDFSNHSEPTVGRELFHEIMPRACAQLDPDRLFHPSSPYGGPAPNWPLEGDWHDYSTLKFSPESSVPLFASEVGRVSTPSLNSMRQFMSEQELWPDGFDPVIRKPGRAAWPQMWQYRSVGGSWDKVGHLERYCEPATAEELIRSLGMAHGDYLRDRVERQRRGAPEGRPDGNRRCWGNIVWRLNDSWPIIYWSVIDYYLEPKMAFYFLRRAYDPVLVSFEQTNDRIAVWVVNDSPHEVAGTLEVRRRRFEGRTLGTMEASVRLEPGGAKRCLVTTELGPVYLRDEFLQGRFADTQATHLLIAERYLHLPNAKLKADIVDGAVEISSDVYARTVSIEMASTTGAVFQDNFFDIPPGETRRIGIVDRAGGHKVVIKALNAEAVELTLE